MALAAFLAALASLLAYAYWIEPQWIDTEQITMAVPGISPDAAELNVIFIADMHVEEIGRRERRLVRMLQAIKPDLLLVGGDFVTVGYYMSDVLRHASLACSLISEVPTTFGTYAVWGNNDFPDEMRDLVTSYGVKVIENDWHRLSLGGVELTLLGLGDPVTGRADWLKALRNPPPPPVLTLAHSPDALHDAARHGLPALLVGHTHGGQVLFPFMGLWPERFLRLRSGTPAYRAGFYSRGSTTMYVSRGIGTSYVPLRFLCRPEITKVVLVPESR